MMKKPPRIKIPEAINAGEVIEVKTLATHIMETGNRKDPSGKIVPRDIIHTFTASFEGQEVFSATLGSGIAANPYIAFYMRVPGAGTLTLTWADDGGIDDSREAGAQRRLVTGIRRRQPARLAALRWRRDAGPQRLRSKPHAQAHGAQLRLDSSPARLELRPHVAPQSCARSARRDT